MAPHVCGDCGSPLPDSRDNCLRCGWARQPIEALPPIARSSDPSTSHEAADKVTRSGARVSIMSRVLDTVRAEPGLTYGEIADRLADLRPDQVWRRVSDLKNKHLIFYSGEREWHENKQQVCWPVAEQPEQRPLM